MTHRQELAWAAWEEMDFNAPGKTEYYLMQCAAETVRVNAKSPGSVRLKDFVLRTDAGASRASPEQTKAALIGAFGAGVTHKTRTRAEAIALGLLPPDDAYSAAGGDV